MPSGTGADVFGVHFVILASLSDHVLRRMPVSSTRLIKRAQLHIGNVLRHIAADAAVHLLDPAGVPPARECRWIAV